MIIRFNSWGYIDPYSGEAKSMSDFELCELVYKYSELYKELKPLLAIREDSDLLNDLGLLKSLDAYRNLIKDIFGKGIAEEVLYLVENEEIEKVWDYIDELFI